MGRAPSLQPKRLPELLTEVALVALYETMWRARQLTHVIMLTLRLFTRVQNATLVHLRLTDVNLGTCQLRMTQGKGAKERYVLFPPSFRGERAQDVERQRTQGATSLFASK